MKWIVLFLIFASASLWAGPGSETLGVDMPKKTKVDPKELGCCKIEYSGGGFDYFRATEKECKEDPNYKQFLPGDNSLCFQWIDSGSEWSN